MSASSRLKSFRRVARAFRLSCIVHWRRASCGSFEGWWLAQKGCTWEFAVLRVCGEGSICVRMSEAVFCKMHVISKFAVSAKDCGEIFFLEVGRAISGW